ncbi:MAG: 4Fe-4S dicluster domain-containing protein, partial [Thermodesulfobacteriota bacterium]
MSDLPKSEEILKDVDHAPPKKGWMNIPVDIRKGMYCYAANPKSLNALGFPNVHEWNPKDEDWNLPENWQEILHKGFKERLDRFRSVKVFMDICVRCGACADKCHYFIGTGDPKNMPVLRAELLRSVYRNDFTLAGKLLGKVAGARKMDEDVLKEWWYYLFQCSECRRCSVFCPYGIDTAEITIFGRELLNLLGLNIDWIATPVANCYRTGNHLGIQPHAFKDMLDFF